MPALKRSQAENPLTGAGIIRYFNEERGIEVEPMLFIGMVVAFIVFELVLKLL